MRNNLLSIIVALRDSDKVLTNVNEREPPRYKTSALQNRTSTPDLFLQPLRPEREVFVLRHYQLRRNDFQRWQVRMQFRRVQKNVAILGDRFFFAHLMREGPCSLVAAD